MHADEFCIFAAMSLLPSPLKSGDVIGITCPAGYIPMDRVVCAIETLKSWGFQTKLGKTVGSEYHYFSGHDANRLQDLQQMLDDPSIKAILMGRGGYGCSRIIDDLDFTDFLKHPKWICGFSDITVLHSHIQRNFGIPTLHSPMCAAFQQNSLESLPVQSLKNALLGKTLRYEIPSHPFNREGRAMGILTGGNLAMLAHLTGSNSQVETSGKILFLEDVGEYLYNTDRMLMNLKRSGQLSELAGLVVGSFTDMQDTERAFGQTVEEIIWDKVKDYDYPVLFGFPCGHQEANVTLQLGMWQELVVEEKGGSLFSIRDSKQKGSR